MSAGAAIWSDATAAAALFAIDPIGTGGIRVRAGAGPVHRRWTADHGRRGRPESSVVHPRRTSETSTSARRICPHRGPVVHGFGPVVHTNGDVNRFTRPGAKWFTPGRQGPSVGVDQLADRGDLAAQLVVDGALARDLVAGGFGGTEDAQHLGLPIA